METTNLIPAIIPSSVEVANPEVITTSYPQVITQNKNPSFLEGPSTAISLKDLTEKSIVPFYKDGESISHQAFITTVMEAAKIVWGDVSEPQIRVSHLIRGKKNEAIGKSTLSDNEFSQYYERMAFKCEISNIKGFISGQDLTLSIAGVRSYYGSRFHSKKPAEKFSICVGHTVFCCDNQCIRTDGTKIGIQCYDIASLFKEAITLFMGFNIEKSLLSFDSLQNAVLSESQFCSVLGRMRLLNAMSPSEQKKHPAILMGDSQMNAVARLALQEDNPFRANPVDGSISLWNFHNLLTESIKSSYIDLALPRFANATDLSVGLASALDGMDQTDDWFLN